MIIQCHPYNSCHVQQPFLEHCQGFIQFQCPSLFADDFIISLHELDISFDIFPRSKMMLTPLKINQQNLQKKNIYIYNKKTSEPIHLHFWGGSTKMKTFQGFSPPPKPTKKNQQIGGFDVPRERSSDKSQRPAASQTNMACETFLGFFCGKGKVEEFMLKYVSLYIMINMYIYIYKYTCIMYLYK